jgi:hypothetical protein
MTRRPAATPAVLETRIAVRAHVPRTRPVVKREQPNAPRLVLVLDTETTTDEAQALTFGSCSVYTAKGKLNLQGIFYADDLPDADRAVLRAYVATHAADDGRPLRLWSRTEFVRQVLWPIAYRTRALVVGFNLPFDLARLATGWHPSEDGGFTLELYDWVDDDGRRRVDTFRPGVRVRALDKRSFISFTALRRTAAEHRGPGGWYRGRFLDLHTFAYALTDDGRLSLDAAARRFGLNVAKADPGEHGVISADYIDYNRQDVRVTWALYEALLEEWTRHPIDLSPEQAWSPAAVAKAYLIAAGVTPPLSRSDVSDERLGQAMTAYFGGRTECRIRGVPVPVRYADFSSMYPTVFSLLELWPILTAERLGAEDATDDARRLLAGIDRASLHDPRVWPALAGVFCRIRPAGDLLPVRARYGAESADAGGDEATSTGNLAWTIGLNRLEADADLWFTLADLLAAKLLGRTTPEILEAFRVVPHGQLASLRPIRLRGQVRVDPRRADLFRVATEQRARIKADATMLAEDRARLGQFLKTLANGGAYGIGAEFRQLPRKLRRQLVRAYGLTPLDAEVAAPEEPGAFCFPPLAATVTGAARLLLALLQADVEARGGTYAACDTDSLLIVASEAGGLVPCPGGTLRTADGRTAVRALSWAEVTEVLHGLEPLNPYADGTVPRLIKLEEQNFAHDDPHRPVELLCVAGSSKRYVLYECDPDRSVRIRKPSEHGLGLYRSPLARRPEWTEPWPEWVDMVWRRALAAAEETAAAPDPAWFSVPAVSQARATSPLVLAPFDGINRGLPYARQVKPFGFLTLGHADPLAPVPAGLTEGRVTPIAPYTTDPASLLGQPWRNRREGQPLAVTTSRRPRDGAVRLRTVGDVAREHLVHPEAKSGDPRGGPGRRGSRGLLPRLSVRATSVAHIGKESNRLEEVEEGLVDDSEDVYVEYRDERREWEAALPAVRRLRDERGWRHLAEASGLSERALRYALNSGKVPHRRARAVLLRLVAGRQGGDPSSSQTEPGEFPRRAPFATTPTEGSGATARCSGPRRARSLPTP